MTTTLGEIRKTRAWRENEKRESEIFSETLKIIQNIQKINIVDHLDRFPEEIDLGDFVFREELEDYLKKYFPKLKFSIRENFNLIGHNFALILNADLLVNKKDGTLVLPLTRN